MQLRNSAARYGVVTKSLHWATAFLLAFQFATGLTGTAGDDVHGTVGLAILGLVVLRLAWRWTTPLPDWAPSLSARERHLAHWTERLLYLAIIAKVVTGLFFLGADGDELEIPVFGELPPVIGESDRGEDTFETAHAWAGYILLALISAHVALILKHQWVDRDRLLHRMLPFSRTPSDRG